MLAGCEIFLLPAGNITKERIRLLHRSIETWKGTVVTKIKDSTTHVLVDSKYDHDTARRLCRKMSGDLPEEVRILSAQWLFKSLAGKCRLDETAFSLKPHTSEEKKEDPVPTVAKKRKMADVREEVSSASDPEETEIKEVPRLPRGTWVCATSSLAPTVRPQHNEQVIRVLSEMADTYKSTNDKWRAFGYQKAIQALKKLDHPISSRDEAFKLPGIGSRLAEKIWEIVESGRLEKLENLRDDDRVRATQTFTAIWGVGPTTAQAWVQAGHRTLDDIRSGVTNLTKQQEVGLRYFDDLLERMPREEAGQIVTAVQTAVNSEIGDGFIVEGCGSYRRGRDTCGDVDVLITHPDGASHCRVFPQILRHLEETKFLIEHLVTLEENGNQKKYLGVCKLSEESKARRIDIIVVPYSEYGCARLYFTGSAHFTRSMRHLAKRLGMSLNEHCLSAGVVRNNAEKIYKGAPLVCPTEESVFKYLGIPFREPHERDH